MCRERGSNTEQCMSPGDVRCERHVEVHLRQDVQVARQPHQQDSGHEKQEAVLHRRTGYRRFRDLRGIEFSPNYPYTIL